MLSLHNGVGHDHVVTAPYEVPRRGPGFGFGIPGYGTYADNGAAHGVVDAVFA